MENDLSGLPPDIQFALNTELRTLPDMQPGSSNNSSGVIYKMDFFKTPGKSTLSQYAHARAHDLSAAGRVDRSFAGLN